MKGCPFLRDVVLSHTMDNWSSRIPGDRLLSASFPPLYPYPHKTIQDSERCLYKVVSFVHLYVPYS